MLLAWGYDETGQRILLDVVLGQRERSLTGWRWAGAWPEGRRAPMLVVTDGPPGLIRAMEELRPEVGSGARSIAGGT